MLITAQGRYRLPAILIQFSVLIFTFFMGWSSPAHSADTATDAFCAASESYLAEMKDYQASLSTRADSSCLTDYVSVAKHLESYQLVDTRSADSHPWVTDAWHIPVAELRTKAFLKDRPLLLIGEGFSRVRAAADCAALGKAGFSQVKILIGGADTWLAANERKGFANPATTKSVSARELVFEYFNGQVVLVATSESLAKKIESLGMTASYSGGLEESVHTFAVTGAGGGFDPVVVISDKSEPLDDSLARLPNVFVLDGGVAALAKYFEKNLWTNLNRKGVPRRYMCGNA